jgi:hypothetical protein
MILEVLAKGTIYSCRAHIATSFVPAGQSEWTRVLRRDLEILGDRASRFRIHECQVSGRILLHSS